MPRGEPTAACLGAGSDTYNERIRRLRHQVLLTWRVKRGLCPIGPTCEMKAPWTDPGLRELLALAALAAFGCGLALAQGEFFFGAIFAAASAL